MKVKCTAKVRELLVKLDEAFERHAHLTEILADRSTDPSTARRAGADREAVRTLIRGIAWRINKASKGIRE
jgi:hypothetical protein